MTYDLDFDGELRARSVTPAPLIISALGIMGYLIGAWGILWAKPYDLCLMAQIMAFSLALVIVFAMPKAFAITRDVGRPSVGSSVFLSSRAFGLRGFWDTHMVDWQAPLFWELGAAAARSVRVSVIPQKLRLKGLTVVFALGRSAIWGILIFVTKRFDEAAISLSPVIAMTLAETEAQVG